MAIAPPLPTAAVKRPEPGPDRATEFAPSNKLPRRCSGDSGTGGGSGLLNRLQGETLQPILAFLEPRDRFALLSTQRWLLAEEPLAATFRSTCGCCDHCASRTTEHLCEQGDRARPASFWRCLLRYSGATGLATLSVADAKAFDATVLKDLHPSELQRAIGNLVALELNRCHALGPDGLAHLASACSSLQVLRIREMTIDSTALAHLIQKNRKTLRVVEFDGCHTLVGKDIHDLASCSELEDLSLRGCFNVANSAIVAIIAACPRIRRLNLRYCHKVDDSVVAAMSVCLPKLRDLNLRYCCKITDNAVTELCSRGEQLRSLNLSQCAKITDAAILKIATQLKSLEELRLWGCAKLTAVSVFAIIDGLPALCLIDIRSRNKLEAVIGGSDILKSLTSVYPVKRVRWEQVDEVGVFRRLQSCIVAA